jgi:hypothetical protein
MGYLSLHSISTLCRSWRNTGSAPNSAAIRQAGVESGRQEEIEIHGRGGAKMAAVREHHLKRTADCERLYLLGPDLSNKAPSPNRSIPPIHSSWLDRAAMPIWLFNERRLPIKPKAPQTQKRPMRTPRPTVIIQRGIVRQRVRLQLRGAESNIALTSSLPSGFSTR